MAKLEHIITQHPRLYHMAEAGSWENIKQRGLCSTTALLSLFEVPEPRRTQIEEQYRPNDEVICRPGYGRATIRNQTPMKTGMLQCALTDMEPSKWYKLLNGKVFFWSTKSRLYGFLTATTHRNRPHDVLTVCTRSLIEQYVDIITLSPINSGTVRHINHRRGSHTFRTIADYRCTDRKYKGERECFAELAVASSVPDIVRHTLSADRWKGTEHQRIIWSR